MLVLFFRGSGWRTGEVKCSKCLVVLGCSPGTDLVHRLEVILIRL